MEFGKAASLEGIDFTLPPDYPRSARIAPGRAAPAFRVFSGATAWTTKEWVGRVYPPRADAATFLEHYGRAFDAVELNTTHYRVPDVATLARWRDAVPAGFRYFPKFPQVVSHADDLASQAASARAFADRMALLGDRLGRSFLQLPPTFTPPRAPELAALLDALPKEYPVAVEFRHPKWFRSGVVVDEAFELLAARGAVAVITDVAGRRDVLHASITTPAAFVRFIGNLPHPSDAQRLGAWADRIARWKEAGLSEVAFFLHEPDNVLAPEAVNLFAKALAKTCGPLVREWKSHVPRQLGLF